MELVMDFFYKLFMPLSLVRGSYGIIFLFCFLNARRPAGVAGLTEMALLVIIGLLV
jgi:hypothetical protein